ncbi:hypothetical protein [Nocardioides donggukensis]|uniref:Protein kinase domain-containing protein n=1 Tax=Nocardioides donggukensis TaxID=2774019 RepID=A0A927K8M5_9ACTN|nr:hypothetical protein [Nocardioides donggukensis]MBD8870998.1 hypothetical protein [Nocardioides donggukensis]
MPGTMRPGDVLAGRYRLVDLLSEARGGRFWRAWDSVLARHVALHLIAEGDDRAPALMEAARRSATLHDPRLLRVLDADVVDGLCFVVNEWGEGESLDQMLVEGPLTPRRAAWLVSEVGALVAHAHESDIAHGRLVPENVLIDEGGAVKIIGLAVDAALHGLPSTRTAADVVDLAALLYAAMTGKWPGNSGSRVPAAPQEHGWPLRPRQVRAGVPRVLDALCDEVLGAPSAQPGGHDSARAITDALVEYVGDPAAVAEAEAARHRGNPTPRMPGLVGPIPSPAASSTPPTASPTASPTVSPTASPTASPGGPAAATPGPVPPVVPGPGPATGADAGADPDRTAVQAAVSPSAGSAAGPPAGTSADPAAGSDTGPETEPEAGPGADADPGHTDVLEPVPVDAGDASDASDRAEGADGAGRAGRADDSSGATRPATAPAGEPAGDPEQTPGATRPRTEETQAGVPVFYDEIEDVGWMSSQGESAPPPPPPFEETPERPLFAPDPPEGQPVRVSRATGAAPTDHGGPGPDSGSMGGTGTDTGGFWPWETGAGVPAPPTEPGEDPEPVPGRSWLRIAAVIAAVVVLLVVIAYAFDRGRQGGGTPATSDDPEPSPTVTDAQPVRATATDFDPQGDPPAENPELAPLAVDGDAATAWQTSTYRQNFGPGGLKTGVGLLLDLGEVRDVAQVELTFTSSPTAVQLLAADSETAPSDEEGLRTVAEGRAGGNRVTLTPDEPTSARYVVVWLTSLPAVDGGFRGQVAEIQVLA